MPYVEYLLIGTRVKSVAVYGGTNVQSGVEELRKGPEIVVATPGRLIHLVRDGHVRWITISI